MMEQDAIISRVKFISLFILIFAFSFMININLIIPTFLLVLILYSRLPARRRESQVAPPLLYLALLFIIIFYTAYFIIRNNWSELYIPFSLVPMLVMVLFNRKETAFLISLLSSVVIAALAGGNFYLAIISLISGICSSLLVRDVRRRGAIIRAAFFIGIIQAALLFFIEGYHVSDPYRYGVIFLNGLLSGVVVVGVLPIFEYLFKTVTNISLLELADFNHPLLQRMILEAPGTYHHSLIVGNLSEAACRAIGAHALLARVGAYYHDIGKLSKPDYFSENQGINLSKHDSLSPTMSKLIIMNHVKEGAELAKKHKLYPILINFIQSHHGKSLVYYFYVRALEGLEEDQQVKEEGFRYPGPKPRSRETAVVLLADSVEAATRALKEPNHEKVREVVHKIINNKFIDGQLDECDLTLKDLEKISAIFVHILGGIYHIRVGYPQEKKSENNNKKPAKENSNPSERGKKHSP